VTCRELERLIEEQPGAPLDARAAAHLVSCAACRELTEIVRASLAGLDEAPEPPRDMTRAVMARTIGTRGGTVCDAAGERLAELADGSLEGIDRDLVSLHRDGCDACGDLYRAMVWMGGELPRMAEIDPGEQFTAGVVSATRSLRQGRLVSMEARLTAWWERLRERPRLPWEVAYAGAVVLWLLFGAGFSPFRAVPARALELARANPVRELADVVQPASLGRQVWQSTGGPVVEKVRTPAASLAHHGAEAFDRAIQGDLSGSGVRLKDMGGDLMRIIDELRPRRKQSTPGSQEA